ncbi:MAG TPA: hypothetical protein VIF60_15145 [Burkholderiaceae bacterium]
MSKLANFLPSRNGMHYPNTWPSEPDLKIGTPFGDIPIGDASNGLCGGMAFVVRDLFEANRLPPPTNLNPDAGSPAYQFIVKRLFDSFNIPSGVAEYYEWMNLPAHDTDFGPHGTSWRTIKESMPALRKSIDGGHPCPLALVCIHSTNPMDLGQNHQVLAYGYEDQGNTTTVYIYDSNHPDDDSATISFDTSKPEHTTTFHYSAENRTVLGFFTTPYSAANPAPLFEDGHTPPAGWQSPGNQAVVGGTVDLAFSAFPDVNRVDFTANYATNPADISTVGWHPIGSATQRPDKTWHFAWDTSQIADQGNFGWGTVNLAGTSYINGQQVNPTVYRLIGVSNDKPKVGFTAPAGHGANGADPVIGVQATITVYAPGASSVDLSAYYASNPNDSKTVAWHEIGKASNLGHGMFSYTWNTTSVPNQNNTGWGTVNLAATPTYNGKVAPPNQRFYQRVKVQH